MIQNISRRVTREMSRNRFNEELGKMNTMTVMFRVLQCIIIVGAKMHRKEFFPLFA